jgi:molybdenum cofactor guanylyltransferase
MSNIVDEVAGVVLAGGYGTRFGSDKICADFHGQPLWQHAMNRLASQTNSTYLSCRKDSVPSSFDPSKLIFDLPSSELSGPRLGINAALSMLRSRWLVTVPVDCPNFPIDLVAMLHSRAKQQDSPACIFVEHASGKQPLFAMYDVGKARQFVNDPQPSVWRWQQSMSATALKVDDIGPFVGANTSDELQKLAAKWRP